MIMESSKTGRWIIPFKEFSRLSVNSVLHFVNVLDIRDLYYHFRPENTHRHDINYYCVTL